MGYKKYPTYRHPAGVDVLTFGGFLQAEADRDGTTPEAVLMDIWQKVEEENQRAIAAIRADPMATLNGAMETYGEEWEGPKPVSVVELRIVEVSEGLSRQSTKVVAVVECDDGKRRLATFRDEHIAATFYEPPDGETTLDLEELND